MKLIELEKKINGLGSITPFRLNKVMIRNCVDGKMYNIEEISFTLYGNEPIIIIDIEPEVEK